MVIKLTVSNIPNLMRCQFGRVSWILRPVWHTDTTLK